MAPFASIVIPGEIIGNFIFLECFIALFYALYFPLIMSLKDKHIKKPDITFDNVIFNTRLFEIAKQLHGEENMIFLQAIERYKSNIVTMDYLITMFMKPTSPFELNISHDLRNGILNSNGNQQLAYLDRICNEIKLLVDLNIMPYM
eukprot:NODE_224_length_12322_cov_0.795549.p13 type:complete len:146 gc:universal NODE_224_length_12322_cov_0.795549:10065-10502(+)